MLEMEQGRLPLKLFSARFLQCASIEWTLLNDKIKQIGDIRNNWHYGTLQACKIRWQLIWEWIMNIVAIVRLIVDKNGDSLLSKQKSPLKQIEQYYYRFEVLQATQFQRKLNNSKKARQLPGNCLLRILLIFQKKKTKKEREFCRVHYGQPLNFKNPLINFVPAWCSSATTIFSPRSMLLQIFYHMYYLTIMFTIHGKKEENNLNQNGRYKVTMTILEDLEKQVG